MPEALRSLTDIADRYEAIVFDQWGVLHNGTAAYPGVPDVLRELIRTGHRLAVLSNSGKRADVNASRIRGLGFAQVDFETVMTSGEAFWQDISDQIVSYDRLYPVEASNGDAERWAAGLDLVFAGLEDAEAILLMGVPEGTDGSDAAAALRVARGRNLPLVCTNPDRVSPRADGQTQISPGTLARDYATAGGTVTYYGKPHRAIFDTLARTLDLPPDRILMVGDSLEHDITGAASAGWSSVFVTGGLGFGRIRDANAIAVEAGRLGGPLPDFFIPTVR